MWWGTLFLIIVVQILTLFMTVPKSLIHLGLQITGYLIIDIFIVFMVLKK